MSQEVKVVKAEITDEPEMKHAKKRTKRGLAIRLTNTSQDNDSTTGIPIYTSQINNYVKERKNMIANVALALEQTIDHHDEDDYNFSDIEESNDFNITSEPSSPKKKDEEIQAPLSPPRYVPQEQPIKKTKINKKCMELLQNIESLQARHKLDLLINDTSISEPVDDNFEECIVFDKNREFSLKIRYKSKIKRITMKMNQPFHTIVDGLATSFEVQPAQILLTFQDSIINLGETPNKLGITVSDIIDCRITRLNKTTETQNLPQDDESVITLKLQSKNMRRKISLSIYKTDNMAQLVQKFAEHQNLPVDKISLQFDGDDLDLTSTPEENELENDYCIDVIVKT